jgi:hypothetical protein
VRSAVIHYDPTRAASRLPRSLIAPATLLLLTAFAQPAFAGDGGVYVGAELGHTLSTYHRADLDSALVDLFSGAGYSAALSGSSVRNEHNPWSANVGYQISSYFALEASYIHLGTLKYATSGTATSVLGNSPVAVDLNIKSRGPALALVGVLPMTDSWDLEARLGAYEGKTTTLSEVTIGTSSNPGVDTKTSTSLMAGIGTGYVIAAHWVVRLDYTHLNQLGEKSLGKSFNVDLLTAGVTYAF